MNAPQLFNVEVLKKHIDDQLQAQLSEIIEQEAAHAAVRVRGRVHELTAQVVLKMLSSYNVERNGSHLLITVKDEKPR